MSRRRWILGVCAGAALAAVGRTHAAPSGARVLRFGQSSSLTGGQAAYGKDVQTGIAAAFAAASTADAGLGVQYELQTLDDGGVRSNCLRNALALTDSGVLALVGLTSGAGAEACLPLVEDTRVPLLGTASGNMGIRASKAAGMFHVRAGYDAEYQRMVSYVKDIGMRRVGVVYLGDTSRANLDAMTATLAANGIVPLVSLPVDRNAASFDATVTQLLAAQLDCVLFTANAAPVAKIINGMKQAHFAGLFYASSFAGQDLIDMLTARQQSCVMSLVVPRPTATRLGLVTQFQRDLTLVGAGARAGITTLEGYIVGRVAVEAARSALRSGSLNRERFREALAGLRTDLGGYRVSFADGAQGSRYVDLLTLDRYGRLLG